MFPNRSAAGRVLAQKLQSQLAGSPALVLALAPGGVLVAAQISAHLHLPLDVLLVRDLDVALVIEGGTVEIDQTRAAEMGMSDERLDAIIEYTRADLERAVQALRGNRPFPPVWGVTVVLVDDGCSSPRAIDAAVRFLRAIGAARVVFAAPVIAADLADGVAGIVDDLVHLETAAKSGAAYDEDTPLREADLLVQLLRARLAA